MALRLTPGTAYASTGQRVGDALFSGLEDFTSLIQKRALADEGDKRMTARELLKDYTDKVMAGKLEPEQAAQAMQAQGFKVPATYFSNLQPNVEQGLQSVIGGMTKAASSQEVEGETALAHEPVLKRVPFRMKDTTQPAQPDETVNGGQTLPSTSLTQFSPEFDNLLKIRNEKLDSFAPQQVAHVDAQGNDVTEFVPSRPDRLTGRTFQTKPNPTQAGQRAGEQSLAEQATKLAGNFGTGEGQLDTQKENAARGAKVQTAVQSARGVKQADLDVENAPANVAKEASRQAQVTTATTTARQEAERAGVPPEIARNYIYTAGGGPGAAKYAYIPADVPSIERSVAIRALATAGVRQVDKSSHEALVNIQNAAANYNDLINQFQGRLSLQAKGRPLSALQNKLGVYTQSDPQLAAAIATSFPQQIALLKGLAGSLSGGIGRIMQAELTNTNGILPLPSDTWRDVQFKKMRIDQMFSRTQDAILGTDGR